ncbi:hypothetical protein OH492_02615 [Vibrio chagasii]|nr:hypothetical protein [Vibrio chagasii]
MIRQQRPTPLMKRMGLCGCRTRYGKPCLISYEWMVDLKATRRPAD